MRVLLDHNVPIALRYHLDDHDVQSARYAKLDREKDPALLQAAGRAGFDVVLTGDADMPAEVNLNDLPCALIVIEAHPFKLSTIQRMLPELRRALNQIEPRSLVRVRPSPSR